MPPVRDRTADGHYRPPTSETTKTQTDWEPIRRAMRRRIDATSLRDFARELDGVSPSGLQNFIDGTTPKGNAEVYRTWFLRHGAQWGGGDAVLEFAIEIVIRSTPHQRRGEVRAYVEEATGIASRI